MLDLIYWDHYYDKVLLLNLVIVIGLFTSIRLFSGAIAHINASYELLTKDNPAFGISLAGVTFAVTIMLSGTVYGAPGQDSLESAAMVALYGILGIVLMALTRFIFNRVTLPAISIRDEIVKKNVAVAIADTANVLAAAIIIRAVMVWTANNSAGGIPALLAGYAISQAVLTATTFLGLKAFGVFNDGLCVQKELGKDNIAVALRFAGEKIGTAFAIAMASEIVVYEVYDTAPVLAAWFIVSVFAVLALRLLSFIAEKIILYKVDVKKEVLDQQNIAIGALQGVIYMSLGLLLSQI